MKKQTIPARRKRTTQVHIVVPTTIKEIAKLLGVPAGTIGQRYHRIKDQHPRSAVLLSALAESHKTSRHRGQYAPRR